MFRPKPTATETPLSKAYEADKKRSADATRQAMKTQDQVSRRAKERLEIAEARHRRVIAGMEEECNAECHVIDGQTTVLVSEAARLEASSRASVEQLEALTREHEVACYSHGVDRQVAMGRIVTARAEAAENTRVVEAHVREAQEAAAQSASSSRQSAKAKRDELVHSREGMYANEISRVEARDIEKEGLLQSLDAQSHAEVVRSEVARQRAAMAIDLHQGRQQAMTAESQGRVSRNEEVADDKVFRLNKVSHLMQNQVDVVLKDKLRDSALNLEAAHEYCQEVRRLLASENAQFKRRMRQIELEAAASARAEERKVLALEEHRLDDFNKSFQVCRETNVSIATRRAECEAEIDEIHKRLRQAETDSRQRADQILAQWVAGSEAAEQAVRQLEGQGRNMIESMQSDVSAKLKAFIEKTAAVQEQGQSRVAELERQANKVVDATQPTLEAARRDDEREAAAALAKWRESRGVPDEISRKADAEIEAKDAEAKEKEAELSRQADMRIAAARAATKAAHEEEKWLQAETAEAWSRIRKACFELRLVNLHDFAQGIVSGDYDVDPSEVKRSASNATLRPGNSISNLS